MRTKLRLTLTHVMKQKMRQIRPKNNFQNTSQQKCAFQKCLDLCHYVAYTTLTEPISFV